MNMNIFIYRFNSRKTVKGLFFVEKSPLTVTFILSFLFITLLLIVQSTLINWANASN